MRILDCFKTKEESPKSLKRTPEGFIKIPIEELVSKAIWQESDGFGEGAIVSDKITKGGYKVGYFHRDEPKSNHPDSGWRFWAGNEVIDDLDAPKFHHVFAFNTIANYDPDIIPYLALPVGSRLIRQPGGQFVRTMVAWPYALKNKKGNL